jgi:hypothetical protein
MPFNLQDYELSTTLPLLGITAAPVVTADVIDLGQINPPGDFLANCELVISAPAIPTGKLPDGQTVTYSVETSNDKAFANGTAAPTTVIVGAALVQTGASSAGAAAATGRVRLPTTVGEYIRVKATGSASAAPTTETATVGLRF